MKLGYTVEVVFVFKEAPNEEYLVEKPYRCLIESEAYKKADEFEQKYEKVLGHEYPIYAFNRYCGNGTVKFIKTRLSKRNKCFLEKIMVG